MAKPPVGYSVSKGAYFDADGQGPYAWDGISMTLRGGSGGSGSGSGGSDLTAATVGGSGILTYTIGGVPWVVTYSGSVPVRESLAQAPSLGADLIDVGGGNYIIDPADTDAVYFQGGELRMTLAQRNTWTASNSGNPTIGTGFKIFVTDVGQVIDAAGVSSTPGGSAAWAGSVLKFQWAELQYAVYQVGTTVNFASGALALSRQLDIAGTVIGPYDQVFLGTAWNMTGVAGTRRVQMNVGSFAVYDNSGLAAVANSSVMLIKTMNGIGVNSQLQSGLPVQPYDSAGAVANPLVTSTVDTSATVSVTGRATVASGDTATCRILSVKITKASGIFG